VRGRGVALATANDWLAAWVVAQTFLTLVRAISTEGTFMLFVSFCVVSFCVVSFCVVSFIYVRWLLPETKGKTLEEVDPVELHHATDNN
jgi:MFS transporter, SP family, galactose:H+ symporter